MSQAINCIYQDGGLISGQKNKRHFYVNDMFSMKIILKDSKRRWVPKFWFDDHPEELEGKAVTVMDLDARIPLMIGCVEYISYLLSCNTETLSEKEQKFLNFVDDSLRITANKIADNMTFEENPSDKAYQRLEGLMRELQHKAFPDPTSEDLSSLTMFRKTKNCNTMTMTTFIKAMTNKLSLLLRLDREMFDQVLFVMIRKILNEAFDLANELKLEKSDRITKEKGKLLGESLNRFMRENGLNPDDALAKMAMISGASVEDWGLFVDYLTTAFYDTRGAITVKNKEREFFDLKKKNYVSSFQISDCTTACCLLFTRLLFSMCETFPIKSQTLVDWHDEELDDSIAKCLGTDDFGRFIKSGKQHVGDQTLFAFKSQEKPFIKKSEIINTCIPEFFEQKRTFSDITMDFGLNVLDYEYVDMVYCSEELSFLSYCVELARMAQEKEDKSEKLDEFEETVSELFRENEALRNTISDFESKHENIASYEETILSLRKKLEDLEYVISTKQGQIDELKEKLSKFHKENPHKEEKYLSLNEDTVSKTSMTEIMDYLKEKRIFFVGGRWDMLDRLKEKGFSTENVWQVNRESQKYDRPKDPDVIVLMTKFMNHSLNGSIRDDYPDGRFLSFNGTNLDQLLTFLYEEELKNDEKMRLESDGFELTN